MLTLRTSGTITNIKSKSTSPAFKDAEIGDHIEFSTPLERAGGSRRSTKATYIRCVNCRTHGISKLSFNQLANTLDKIDISDNSDRR